MNERDDNEQETDGYQFRWARCWRAWGRDGGLREYAAIEALPGAERLAEARAAHARDCKGFWVEHGMVEPHVTALRTHQSGKILPEELAQAVELDEVASQPQLA